MSPGYYGCLYALVSDYHLYLLYSANHSSVHELRFLCRAKLDSSARVTVEAIQTELTAQLCSLLQNHHRERCLSRWWQAHAQPVDTLILPWIHVWGRPRKASSMVLWCESALLRHPRVLLSALLVTSRSAGGEIWVRVLQFKGLCKSWTTVCHPFPQGQAASPCVRWGSPTPRVDSPPPPAALGVGALKGHGWLLQTTFPFFISSYANISTLYEHSAIHLRWM